MDRSIKWLTQCMGAIKDVPVVAAVPNVNHGASLTRFLTAALPLNPAGFLLAGLSLGESPADRAGAVSGAVAALPADKPRFVVGLGSPAEVLRLVAAGVDVFDTDYTQSLLDTMYALTIAVDGTDPAAAAATGLSC